MIQEPDQIGDLFYLKTLKNAISLHQSQQFEKAVSAYEECLRRKPQHFETLLLLGKLLAEHEKNREALFYIGQASSVKPDEPLALRLRGEISSKLGLFQEALALYDRAIASGMEQEDLLIERGNALQGLSRLDEALTSYDRALALNPASSQAYNNCGNILKEMRRCTEAIVCYDKAIAFNPSAPEAYNNRGIAFRLLKRQWDALASYDMAISLSPDYAQAHNNRGNVLRDLKRPNEALASHDTAVKLSAGYVEAHSNRGLSLMDLSRPGEALVSADIALSIDPHYAAGHNTRAMALNDLRRPHDALAAYDRALTLNPHYAEAYINKSVLLIELGSLNDARDTIEKAIKLDPGNTRAYSVLAECSRFADGDPAMEALQSLARTANALTVDEQIELHFTLGKAYSNSRDYASSFKHMIEGNRLKRQQTDFDEAATLQVFARTQSVFSRELLEAKGGFGDPSDIPVFILGMPRSGTTLIEQILAGHPDVFAGGEIETFQAAVSNYDGPGARSLNEPEAVAGMPDDGFGRVGSDYVARLGALAPEAKRIVNKLPDNFRLVGLIHLMLPNARIIHARRNPADTCVSCFSTRFVGHQPFTYDLGELGRYYRAYEAMMAHWRDVLPPGVMIDVDYEEVVGDLEAQARRLMSHCGLPWRTECLAFHQSRRQVLTASAAQVRQPIYRSSIGRWRAYGMFLEPLLTALEGHDGSSH